MLTLKKVAVTGGLSSGKSSVCKFLQEKGAYVVSADDIVHELLDPHTAIGKQIVELLGTGVIEGGQFNRKKIADAVFTNKKNLISLEQILHPAVLKEIESRFNQIKDQKKHTLFVVEIPLLYEIEKEHHFDITVVIASDLQSAQKRFHAKTGHQIEEFEKRIMRQLPLEQKCAKADYVIINNGSLAELQAQVNNLYQNLTR